MILIEERLFSAFDHEGNDITQEVLKLLSQQSEREAGLREALEQSEVDARWLVGQWPRLQDEGVRSVALDIVGRIHEALAAHPEN